MGSVVIVNSIVEGKDVTTLRLDRQGKAKPGQFVMVWIPGVDEIPMSLSYIGGNWGITVREVGAATKLLSSMKKGERVGIRGPYGQGFRIPEGRILLAGGGSGTASLMTVAEAVADPLRVDIAIGARTVSELIFEERAGSLSGEVRVATDDGTKGFWGTVVALASSMMAEKEYSMVMGCGPEGMLRYLHLACKEHKVPCQLSLERFMKCGSGLCGSCVVDGLRVCADGPVFSGEVIEAMTEFGKWKRDEAGARTKV